MKRTCRNHPELDLELVVGRGWLCRKCHHPLNFPENRVKIESAIDTAIRQSTD